MTAKKTITKQKTASKKIVSTTKVASVIKNKAAAAVSKDKHNGFVDFLREQSVVGLAIGLVLGTQAKALVDTLMSSFINPFVGLFLPGAGSLATKSFSISLFNKQAIFGWGAFVSMLLTFVIVAAVVYYVFKGLGLDKLDKKKEDK